MVDLEAAGVCVADHVEPVAAPTLSVLRASQQPFNELLERIAPVTLLQRAVGLQADLVGINDDRCEPGDGQRACREERHRACLQGHGCARREIVRHPQVLEARRRCRHFALGDHPSLGILDHEHTLPAVHVHANVVLCHRAALLSFLRLRHG